MCFSYLESTRLMHGIRLSSPRILDAHGQRSRGLTDCVCGVPGAVMLNHGLALCILPARMTLTKAVPGSQLAAVQSIRHHRYSGLRACAVYAFMRGGNTSVRSVVSCVPHKSAIYDTSV